MSEQQTNGPALFCLLLAMLLWASSFVALKLAFRSYDPMVVIFGRMLTASLCFLPLLPSFFRIPFRRGDFKYLVVMAVCEPCLYFILEARALELTSASQAGMITAIMPLLVAVTAAAVLKERVSRGTLAGFALSIAGACWLSLAAVGTEEAPNPLLGNFLELLAMVCAAGYTVTLKHLSGRYSPWFMTAFQAFVGSLFFFPFLLLPSTPLPTGFETVPVLSILYLGVFITLGAYGCYNYSVSKLPATLAAGFINLIPVFSVLMGLMILGETLNLQQYLASGLVLAGVCVSHRYAAGRRKGK